MKIQRTQNAARNVVFGGLYNIYTTIVPFFMRTALIYFMGVQYLGLNGIFASVISVLNLAELGVGSAMVYSMYKPIAEDDKATICALMNLYRRYYRIIGLVIAAAGLCLFPFIPRLVKDDLPPDVNIYVLYSLFLCETVLSYWLFGYKNSILSAQGFDQQGFSCYQYCKIHFATACADICQELLSVCHGTARHSDYAQSALRSRVR